MLLGWGRTDEAARLEEIAVTATAISPSVRDSFGRSLVVGGGLAPRSAGARTNMMSGAERGSPRACPRGSGKGGEGASMPPIAAIDRALGGVGRRFRLLVPLRRERARAPGTAAPSDLRSLVRGWIVPCAALS